VNKKVTLFNFDGSPNKTYEITMERGSDSGSEPIKQTVGHQIIVVDRSGSMWGDIEALKDTIIKVLTLNEFADSEMLVSLVSYSSEGDVSLHFERVPVSQVMKAGSEHLQEIKRIRATYLTCISQAMEVAEGLIDDDETTGIILHSDGYANDPSPRYERDRLEAVCRRISERNVFVNTIAYSNYSDFTLLARLSGMVSGSCVKATDTRTVYETIQESCSMLAQGRSSSVEIDSKGADYTLFVCKDPRKVVGAEGSMTVRGVSDSDYIVFRMKETKTDGSFVADDTLSMMCMYAFAVAKLSEGNINTSKKALMSSRNRTLTERHVKALTPNHLANMASDIEFAIFDASSTMFEYYDRPCLETGKCSILDLATVLDENRGDMLLNISKVKSGYKRRGLKKTAGKREKDGSVTVPDVDVEIIDDGDFIKMGSFDINRDSATINMQVERNARMVERNSGKAIPEVAGILLNNLKDYKKYTIVGDGEINIDSLFVKFSTKAAFEAVKGLGVIDGQYSHTTEYEIQLSELPVSRLSFDGGIPVGTFRKLAVLNIAGRILNSLSAGKSSEYSQEQIEELKSHCLSDSLYINIPMMNEYDDLEEALKDGSVDSRVAYTISIGNKDVLNVGKFKSANAFVERMYEVCDKDGNPIPKPKMSDIFFDPKVSIEHKVLSSRTKVTAADEMQKEIYDEMLGLTEPSILDEIGAVIGVPGMSDIVAVSKSDQKDVDKLVAIIESARRAVASAERREWANSVSPIVFYIGSTGMIPDGIGAMAMDAEEIAEKYPDLGLSKSEKEGTFFEVGDSIISVYSEKSYFSTGKKVEKEDQVQTATA